RTVVLGYDDDIDLMLQIGRAQFREGLVEGALAFFERAVAISPESAEAAACVGYAHHRLGNETESVASLQRALTLEPEFGEARVYLANIMYDAGDMDGALAEFEKTTTEDHWDELGIWRLMELKKAAYKLEDSDGDLKIWEERLVELAGEPDAVDELLSEVEQKVMEEENAAMSETDNDLESLSTLLSSLGEKHNDEAQLDLYVVEAGQGNKAHRVELRDGRQVDGTWEEIVQLMRDERNAALPIDEFMSSESRRQYGATGAQIPTRDAEGFIRGSAEAGLLRIVR
ncbi:MAG: tetratricopeptide repeat protein, partial [Gemmatimonadaceae bacterium]